MRLCTDNIGDIDGFSSLLSQPGVDPDIRDQVEHKLVHVNFSVLTSSLAQHGRTLLVQVCYNGRTDIVQLLITYGADVDLPSEVSTQSTYTFSNQHLPIV